MQVATWLSFVCVSCKERRDDSEMHTLISGDAVCGSCVSEYNKCRECGLYMKSEKALCAECKEL